ncbi:MAG: hypothetical protein WCV83_01640 [Candidatus Magasanikbacteria bacterium]
MNRHPVLDLFLKYAAIDTKSGVNEENHPSSVGQTTLIAMIKQDLLASGATEGQFLHFKDGSMLVRFEGTVNGKAICYAAHVDTSPEAAGGATCIIHEYDGGDIVLPEGDVVISEKDLADKKGTIVTANGLTTLGADDKAGVAILCQIGSDLANGTIAHHPPVDLYFCVDEEIGQLEIGVVPSEIVGSWSAFITLDGGNPQMVDTSCFNGWETIVEFFGQSAHPGADGENLKPAHYAMARLITELQDTWVVDAPWISRGDAPFIYVSRVGEMTPVHAQAEVMPRSFNAEDLPKFHELIVEITENIVASYGVRCQISGRGLLYVNTATAIKQHPEVLDPIMHAIHEILHTTGENAVRGGTDGAMANMKYPGLPSPNLGVGMYKFHGVREFLVVKEMLAMYEVMKLLVPAYAD